jgi:hypothetical protein
MAAEGIDTLADRILKEQSVWQPPAAFARHVGSRAARAMVAQELVPPRLCLFDWAQAVLEGGSVATAAAAAAWAVWLVFRVLVEGRV